MMDAAAVEKRSAIIVEQQARAMVETKLEMESLRIRDAKRSWEFARLHRMLSIRNTQIFRLRKRLAEK